MRDARLVPAASLPHAGCSHDCCLWAVFAFSAFSASLNRGRHYEEASLIYLSYCGQEKATRRNVPSGRPKILFPCRPLPLYYATRRRSGMESGAKALRVGRQPARSFSPMSVAVLLIHSPGPPKHFNEVPAWWPGLILCISSQKSRRQRKHCLAGGSFPERVSSRG